MSHFRTRARTVDLLGRQQIAGIPTAIHELFKNAHDAYADHVEVDYFRRDGLFVLRDDGLGMTRQEFEERWLVVGTESKLGAQRASLPKDPRKPQRPILGEKGIGRLAIGIIGNQVLVLTRAIRDDSTSPLVAAFIHWGIFSAPAVNLSEIVIPVREYADGRVPKAADVKDLVMEFADCVRHLFHQSRISSADRDAIQSDLDRFALDPSIQEQHLPGPSSLRLALGGSGTQFWVFPAAPTLPADLDSPESRASRVERELLGFSNQMTPGAARPVLNTAFRDHRGPTEIRDVIPPERFFVPGEMLNADHYISGNIDEYGQFRGTVSVFGECHNDYVIPFDKSGPTACGPFEIHLAYVQGRQRETTLPDEDWQRFTEKAERLGGVYVYIDGFRILPYGNVDVDWLEIEERRSKHATYYFYSHRRMCGAVLLTRARNADLVEKAGREGFIRNAAYSDLRAIITGILLRTAAEFFRKGGIYTEQFDAARKLHTRRAAAESRRAAGARARKKAFAEELEDANRRIDRGDAHEEAEKFRRELAASTASLQGHGSFEETFVLESSARAQIRALVGSYRVTRPRGSLGRELEREWRRHEQLVLDLEERVFAPLEREANELLAACYAAVSSDGAETYRRRFIESVDQAATATERQISDARNRVSKERSTRFDDLNTALEGDYQRVIQGVQQIRADAPRMVAQVHDEQTLGAQLTVSQSRLEETAGGFLDLAEGLRAQLTSLAWDNSASILEQLAAAEDNADDLRERLDDELEATQLGMAVEVISHEFDHHIRDIRGKIRALKPWADANSGLRTIYAGLRRGFEHLDGYLTLFTPLQRRLYRATTTFTGAEVEAYLQRLFRARLTGGGMKLVASDGFRAATITGYPSTYYPVFVNLVDNAIWWLRDRPVREIRLEADAASLLVCDTGPGVGEHDRELIFERGFSLKPSGRGLGLAIARDSMRRVGGDLRVEQSQSGAVFRIVLPLPMNVEGV